MKNKYNYYKVIQGYFEQRTGWEDLCQYESDSQGFTREFRDLRHDLREYRESGTGQYRVILRREPSDSHRTL